MKFRTIVEAGRKVGIQVTSCKGKWILRDKSGAMIRLSRLSDVRLIVLAEITNRLQAF